MLSRSLPSSSEKQKKRDDWYWLQLQLMEISTAPSLSVTSASHRKSKKKETNQNLPACNSWSSLVMHCFPPSTGVVSLPASHQSSLLQCGLLWCLLQGYISPAEENWMHKSQIQCFCSHLLWAHSHHVLALLLTGGPWMEWSLIKIIPVSPEQIYNCEQNKCTSFFPSLLQAQNLKRHPVIAEFLLR